MNQTNLFRGNVVKSLHLAILLEALQQDVRAKHIVPRKDVRVAKTKIHVRVGGEMEGWKAMSMLCFCRHLITSPGTVTSPWKKLKFPSFRDSSRRALLRELQ
jgi:hypothetical protein